MASDTMKKTTVALLAVGAAILAAPPARASEEASTAGDAEAVPSVRAVEDKSSEPYWDLPRTPLPRRDLQNLEREARHPLDFFGYFWVDTGILDRTTDAEGKPDQKANYMQGRFVLGAQHTQILGDYFARARVEFLGLVNEYSKSQYEPHTLDAYLMLGGERWDFQIGRFLPWEIYHRGSGIELWTAEEAGVAGELGAPTMYWLDATRTYFNEAGQAAVHFYPFDWIGLEVSGVYGQQTGQNFYGVRPAIAFEYAGLQLLAGWERLDKKPQKEIDKVESTQDGWAVRLQYDLPWLILGVNYADSSLETTRIEGDLNSEATWDKWSAGAFANLILFEDHWLGFGYHHTEQENLQRELTTHDQLFASWTWRLPFDGLSVKAVYGYAQGDVEDVDVGQTFHPKMHSFRVRLAYDIQ